MSQDARLNLICSGLMIGTLIFKVRSVAGLFIWPQDPLTGIADGCTCQNSGSAAVR
jgi:hypothetical protein